MIHTNGQENGKTPYEALSDLAKDELREAIEHDLAETEVELPEVDPEAPVDAEGDQEDVWLYASERDYFEQLAYYKRYQEKPVPEEQTRLCEECGEAFQYKKKTARYCSKRCGERARTRST